MVNDKYAHSSDGMKPSQKVTQEMPSSHRVAAYDMARGMGIIFVIIGHALPMDTYGRAFVYSFHMPLFFIISGAVMKPEILTGSLFHKIRTALCNERKLLANYLFYSLCFLIYDILIRYLSMHRMGRRDLVWDVYQTVVLYGINVLWFLITLVIAKTITAIIFSHIHSQVKIAAIAIFAYLFFAVLGNFIAPRLSPTSVMKLVYYPLAAFIEIGAMTPFVMLGHVARPYLPRIIQRFKFMLPFLIVPNILWCFTFGAVDYHLLRSGFPPLSLALSITGTLALFGIGAILHSVPVVCKILDWASRNSLFIMVTHEYLLIGAFIVRPILSQFSIRNDTVYLILYIILLILTEVPLCQNVKPAANKAIAGLQRLFHH